MLDEALTEDGMKRAAGRLTPGVRHHWAPGSGTHPFRVCWSHAQALAACPPAPGQPACHSPAHLPAHPSSCIKQSPYRKCLAFLPGNYSSHSPMRIRACLGSREDSGGWREIPANSLGSLMAPCKFRGPVRSWWPVRTVRRASGSEGHQHLSPPSSLRLSLKCLPWSTA